jgi:hypothetical protein
MAVMVVVAGEVGESPVVFHSYSNWFLSYGYLTLA